MAAKGIQLPWRWDTGTIFTNLDVIWGMSDKTFNVRTDQQCNLIKHEAQEYNPT